MQSQTDVREDLNAVRQQIDEIEQKVSRPVEDKGSENTGLMEILLKTGHEDFLLTDPEVARKLTDKRIELLKTIKEKQVESVKDLAEETGRNWSNVSNDLDLLAQEGIVEFEREGKQKKPVLRVNKIFFKPVEL